MAKQVSGEAPDAEHTTRVADIAVPALRRTRFDGQARSDRRRQHRFTLSLGQSIEQLPARHRHAAHGVTFCIQTLRGRDDQAHLRAAGDQDQIGLAVARIG
jgi:hypothetical protein